MKLLKTTLMISPLIISFYLGLIYRPEQSNKSQEDSIAFQNNRHNLVMSKLKKNRALEDYIMRGDTTSYNCAKNNLYSERLLPFAIVMANKYCYSDAYYDVFHLSECKMIVDIPKEKLIHIRNGQLDIDDYVFVKMDSLSAVPYLSFLRKGKDGGDEYSGDFLSELTKYYCVDEKK